VPEARRHQDAKVRPSTAGGPARSRAGDIDALANMTGLAELDEVTSQAVAGLHEAGYS